MPAVALLAGLAATAVPADLLAQSATGPHAASIAPPDVADAPAAPAPRPQDRSSLLSRAGQMFTGAVIGGWLGFFASQLAVSDWEANAGAGSERRTWAAGGAVLGLLAGHLIAGTGGPAPRLQPVTAGASRPIELDEIERSGAVNAYELIRSLRKDWLIPRGVNSWRESARGSADFDAPLVVVPGADHVLVYLDNARLGGTQTLAEIGLDAIGRVEFIEAAQATFRWGAGHAHGVILLTTRGFESRRQ